MMPRKRIDRRVRRFAVRLPVQELNGRPEPDAWVVDLSSLGACLETATPLAPRLPLRVSVVLPGQASPTVLSGQVVWQRPLTHRPGRFHLGLRFFRPNWEIDRLARTGKL
jgi:hypothetical protein